MRLVMSVMIIWASLQATAQQYRLVCSDVSLPELYTEIEVYAEALQGDNYQKLPARSYMLKSDDAEINGNTVRFSRQLLYKQNGELHFTMRKGGASIPLILSLPILKDIRYNLFTDSIKPVLNYYVNVEGVFSNGKIYPLDTSFVSITASEGQMHGFEWIVPAHRDFEKVTFTAASPYLPAKKKQVTLYMKKAKDPRDAPGYGDD